MAPEDPDDRLRALSRKEDALHRLLLCAVMIASPSALAMPGSAAEARSDPEGRAVSTDRSPWTIRLPTFGLNTRAPHAERAKGAARECVRVRAGSGWKQPRVVPRLADVFDFIRTAASSGRFRAGSICRIVIERAPRHPTPRHAVSRTSTPSASVIRN